ncbi:Hypothetical predicted protein, partial [Marmota monax]
MKHKINLCPRVTQRIVERQRLRPKLEYLRTESEDSVTLMSGPSDTTKEERKLEARNR